MHSLRSHRLHIKLLRLTRSPRVFPCLLPLLCPLPPSEMTAPSSGDNEHVSSAADFSHSWDLATGGFKILTAKRELPSPQQRRGQPASLAEPASEGNYLFLLVLLACLVVMLISGGVVLFMTLQP